MDFNADMERQRRFAHHAPQTDATATLHGDVRYRCLVMSEFIAKLPAGRENAIALTKLEECMFWMNAAIARHQ